MKSSDLLLINHEHVELWPQVLLDANGILPNLDDSALTHWALRDKATGQFISMFDPIIGWSDTPHMAEALSPSVERDAVKESVADLIEAIDECRSNDECIPATALVERLSTLGLDAQSYADQSALTLVDEPQILWFSGFDRYGRSIWLERRTARAWTDMQQAAHRDGIVLEAISGFRSHWYQLGIFRRKLDKGQTVADILGVNAAPGFSEHHSGRALDISTPNEPPAEESFEGTTAFAWLQSNAHHHGFHMSYPRDNRHGITYEPWHWTWKASKSE